MARSATIVKVQDLKEVKGAILAKATASTKYRSAVERLAERKAAQIQAVATAHYQAAINAIDEVLQEGVTGASVPNSRLYVKGPSGADLTVPVRWDALSNRWLKNKAFRSRPGYAPRRTRKGVRAKRPRGRSYGANSFWKDERKLSQAFKQQIVGKGVATVTHQKREIKGGDFELKFVIRFEKLPARYLDRVIRRALMQGAEGLGSIGVAFGNIPTSELTTSAQPRGLARGGWAESIRPTMRPIAQRLGRAMKEQILKSIRR